MAKYKGKHYNFTGIYQRMTNDGEVVFDSAGKRGEFQFDWGDEHAWLNQYQEGDTIAANCKVSYLALIIGSGRQGVPVLVDCQQRR